MTTLLLCPELFAREGGIQRILRLYLKALCDAASTDDEVRLVVLNDRILPEEGLVRYGGDRLTQHHACNRRKVAFATQVARSSAGTDRIVCGHIGQLSIARLGRVRRSRVPYYLVAHGVEVWRPYNVAERLALRGARRILCVSDYTRREMQRHIRLPDSRFVVVPNALDPCFAPEAGECPTDPAEPLILTVARLEPGENYKGVDHLIEALPAVRRAVGGVRLRVVGTGGDLERLQHLANEHGVGGAVEFAGRVHDAALREAYRTCTLFALPSRNEGFGIVFLEAMAHGKPCLGARAGAVPEIVDAASGVLVQFGRVGELASALTWALQHSWNPDQIRSRAMEFSYPLFRERLSRALAVAP